MVVVYVGVGKYHEHSYSDHKTHFILQYVIFPSNRNIMEYATNVARLSQHDSHSHMPLSAKKKKTNKQTSEQLGLPDPPFFYTFGSKTNNIIGTCQARDEHVRSKFTSICSPENAFWVPMWPSRRKYKTFHLFLSQLYKSAKRHAHTSLTIIFDFQNKSTAEQLQILLHGTSLNSFVFSLFRSQVVCFAFC